MTYENKITNFVICSLKKFANFDLMVAIKYIPLRFSIVKEIAKFVNWSQNKNLFRELVVKEKSRTSLNNRGKNHEFRKSITGHEIAKFIKKYSKRIPKRS